MPEMSPIDGLVSALSFTYASGFLSEVGSGQLQKMYCRINEHPSAKSEALPPDWMLTPGGMARSSLFAAIFTGSFWLMVIVLLINGPWYFGMLAIVLGVLSGALDLLLTLLLGVQAGFRLKILIGQLSVPLAIACAWRYFLFD